LANKHQAEFCSLRFDYSAHFNLLFFIGSSTASGVEFYSKDDLPYGIPQDVWMSKWWTWWVTPTIDAMMHHAIPPIITSW
jgi:hypothetical protein